MAPKTAKAKAAAAEVRVVVPPPPAWDPNVEWHVQVQYALDKIKSVFGEDICSRPALPLHPPHDVPNAILGFQEPFNEAMMRQKTRLGEMYVCGVNVLWANPLKSLSPGVPILPGPVKAPPPPASQIVRNMCGVCLSLCGHVPVGAFAPNINSCDALAKPCRLDRSSW